MIVVEWGLEMRNAVAHVLFSGIKRNTVSERRIVYRDANGVRRTMILDDERP